METYRIKKAGLEIRDLDTPFNGSAIEIQFFRMERLAFIRMSNAIALTVAAHMHQDLSKSDLLTLFAEIRHTVAATFRVPLSHSIDVHFDAADGVIYVLSGDIIFFVSEISHKYKDGLAFVGH